MNVGDTFSMQCEITETVYRGFIDLFADRNPLHVDAAFAKSKGFSGVVMHGNILGGFLSRLVGEELPMKNVIIQSQTMTFRLPVYLGDTLRLTAAVAGLYESVNSIELKFGFENASGARVASGAMLVGFLP